MVVGDDSYWDSFVQRNKARIAEGASELASLPDSTDGPRWTNRRVIHRDSLFGPETNADHSAAGSMGLRRTLGGIEYRADPDLPCTSRTRLCGAETSARCARTCARSTQTVTARSVGLGHLAGWRSGAQDEPRRHSRRLVTAAAAQDVGARWDSYFPPERNEIDYHPPVPRLTPRGQRPWQKHRYGSSRTAPERLYRGVWLRCLVCLRVPTALRYDQVCEACEKDWRRKGRPWGIAYDSWLINRRVSQWDKSPEHIVRL